MKFSISDIPQADELEKVILTVEAVYYSNISDHQIANYIGFTERQGRYYRFAAETLGLIENSFNKASLTKLGEELVVLDNENRLKYIGTIISNNSFFKNVLNFIENNEAGVNKEQLAAYLIAEVEGAEATINRRINTIISWLTKLNFIKIDFQEIENNEKQNIYLYNDLLSEDIEDDDKKGSIYPADYSNEELDIKEAHIQVIGLLRKQRQNKILVPEFQRNQVWKDQQKSRFIESLILNIPIPPFYVSQDLDGNFIVVDGLQRSTAINGFLNNEYSLIGLEALPQLNGLTYSALDDELKTRIEDRDLLLYILKPSVPLSIVYDIFNRINSNGTPLTRQEIRNCIFIGNSTKLLKELSESIEFKNAIDHGIPPNRMKDREAILRFFAFVLFKHDTDYKGDLDDFMGKTMRKINRMNIDQIEGLKKRFLRVMELTFEFFKYENFRLPTEYSRGRINIAMMESICYYFDQKNDNYLRNNQIGIQINYQILLNNKEYIESIRISTGSEKNVKMRFNKAFEILDKGLYI